MEIRILVVDDERIVSEVVERYLRMEGYEVCVVEDGAKALEAAKTWQPTLIVLDLMLPKVDGLEVCRQIRQQGNIPVIMLTAKAEEADRIVGLELGADDYMVKPFSPRELVARIKSVLRRSISTIDSTSAGLLKYGDLSINPKTREVIMKGNIVKLTAKEFDLLHFLASNPDEVFTREQLMNEVWDYGYSAEYSTITVHIRRLRAKLETDPLKPRYIKTLWGIGYKFEAGVREV